MPVAEGYAYADTPHPSTLGAALYGCNNGPAWKPTLAVQDGWTWDGRRQMADVPFDPVTKHCGHDARSTDTMCAGCARRKPNNDG